MPLGNLPLEIWEQYVEWIRTQLIGVNPNQLGVWTNSISCGASNRGPFPLMPPAVCLGRTNFNQSQEGTLAFTTAGNIRTYGATYTTFIRMTGTTVVGDFAAGWSMSTLVSEPVPEPPAKPISLPEWMPVPRTAPQVNPEEDPWQDPAPRPSPRTRSSELPWNWPQSTQRGSQAPRSSPRWNTNPGTAPAASTPPGRRGPPPPRHRESKSKSSNAFLNALGRLFTSLTEAKDFMDCLHGALPKTMQTSDTPAGMFADLYKNASHINNEAFTKCFIKNFFEDWVMGRLNKKAQRALQDMRKSFGAGLGVTNPTNTPTGEPLDPSAGPFDPITDPFVDWLFGDTKGVEKL
jgi:hypothetical protein